MAREPSQTAAQRLVSLALHLLSTGRTSTVRAACALAVDRRVARRDLLRLREVMPLRIIGEGRDREWTIDPFADGPPLGILDRLGLMVSSEAVRFLEGTLLANLNGRIDTPSRFAPAHLRRNLDRKVRFKHEPERRYGPHEEVVEAILHALLAEHRLAIEYEGMNGPREYAELEPLTLVVYRRALYILCRRPGERRTLRLAVERIRACRVGERFEYPRDYCPDEELDVCFGIYADDTVSDVVLDFAPAVATYVRARRWHGSEQLHALPGGGVRLEMKTGGRELVRFVLEWGPQCRVVQPAWLADAVRDELRAALRRYDDPVVRPLPPVRAPNEPTPQPRAGGREETQP